MNHMVAATKLNIMHFFFLGGKYDLRSSLFDVHVCQYRAECRHLNSCIVKLIFTFNIDPQNLI